MPYHKSLITGNWLLGTVLPSPMNRHMVITHASSIRASSVTYDGCVIYAIRCGLYSCTTKKQLSCIVTVGGLQDVRGVLVCIEIPKIKNIFSDPQLSLIMGCIISRPTRTKMRLYLYAAQSYLRMIRGISPNT